MSAVAILPEQSNIRGFRAVSSKGSSYGTTMGEALDSLTKLTGDPQETTMVTIQPMQPDDLFTGEQIERMQLLMTRQRMFLKQNTEMPPEEWAELQQLIDAELDASILRTKRMLEKKPQ